VIKGLEAVAVASLIMFVESLQVNIKAAMKLDEGSHSRLMTLTETVSTSQFLLSCIFPSPHYSTIHGSAVSENSTSELQILDVVINKSLVKSIQDVVDDDSSIKDTAVWFLHLIFSSVYF
jgi:hypothetical protein